MIHVTHLRSVRSTMLLFFPFFFSTLRIWLRSDKILFLEILFHRKFASSINNLASGSWADTTNYPFVRQSSYPFFLLARRRDYLHRSLYPRYAREKWIRRSRAEKSGSRGGNAHTRTAAARKKGRAKRSRCSWRSRRTSPKVLHSVYPADR